MFRKTEMVNIVSRNSYHMQTKEKIKWSTKKVLISDLKPAPYNPRRWTDEETTNLTKSLEKFSLADPIIINKNNMVIGGHFRLKILKEKSIQSVDCRIPDRLLDPDEEKELNIRLNRNLGEWDFEMLAEFGENLLKDIGFDSKELDKIFANEPDPEDDVVPDNAPTRVKPGEVWQLGGHRLMCGDSTLLEDVSKLMAGKKSQLIHTDPPYNVDYGANKKYPSWRNRSIKGDKQNPEEWREFCQKLFENFKEFNEGDIYMWGASGPEGMRMRLWLVEAGAHWSATIIWKKQQLVLSPAKYQRIYEPCFMDGSIKAPSAVIENKPRFGRLIGRLIANSIRP